MGSVYFTEPIRKVQIHKDDNGDLIYSYPVWETRDFKEFQNFLPIPQNEIDRNPLLIQNKDYN